MIIQWFAYAMMQVFRGHYLKNSISKKNKCSLGVAQKAESYKAQKVGNSKVSVSDPFSHHMTIFQSSSSVWLLLSCWELEGGWREKRDASSLKSSCSLPSFATFSAGAPHYSHNRLWKRGFRPVNSYRRGNPTALFYRLTSLSAVLNLAA